MLAIDLPKEAEKRLADLADAAGSSTSNYARAALIEYLEETERILGLEG